MQRDNTEENHPIRSRFTPWVDAIGDPKPRTHVNLGAGHDIKKGWLNVDRDGPATTLPKPHGYETNLLLFPWVFDADRFRVVLADQLVEHFPPTRPNGEDNFIRFLKEIERVTVPGAHILLGVPKANSYEDIQNPTHYRRFHESTLDFLDNSDSTLSYNHWNLSVRNVYRTRYTVKPLHSLYHGRKYLGRPLFIGPVQQIHYHLTHEP